jgi:hypothetical protein
MRSRGGHRAIAAALCVALLGLVAACGEDKNETEVVEGEPIELGDLKFTVQLTRFLNPDDNEDSEYVAGQPELPPEEDYLGVFMEIENESDKPQQLPSADDLTVIDTSGKTYQPLEAATTFSLRLGQSLEGDGIVPKEDTAAQQGPIQASVVIFVVDVGISENRPLELELEGDGEKGTIELDI